MKKIGFILCLFIFLLSCENKKTKVDPFSAITHMVDSIMSKVDTLLQMEVDELSNIEVIETNELFDDFIYSYASDDILQQQRTKFPLAYYHGEIPSKIEKENWEHDYLFTKENCYTLLFDKEEELDLIGSDTSLVSVQVECVFLRTRMLKKYYFERIRGAWMLEAINLRQIHEEEKGGFLKFYAKFVTDSLFQSRHIFLPLEYVTIDPDDEFSILETTLDLNQWYAFRPILPVDRLTNINYGQHDRDDSLNKILKVNGIGNGDSNVFHFRKRRDEWELYKYEDTAI